MSLILYKKYIRCVFDNPVKKSQDGVQASVETYFAETKEVIGILNEIKGHIDADDQMRAETFHSEHDRDTFLLCHTLLRIVLAQKLKMKPSEIIIERDRNNKPWLKGNQFYFNISHTFETFVFALSERSWLGIDIERFNRDIDFKSIVKTFFNLSETSFILKDKIHSRERFFILWTRKEAFLKALGTGIINNIKAVEVFRDINFLDRQFFNTIQSNAYLCDYYIYSGKYKNNYVSLALPEKSKVIFNHLNIKSIKDLLQEVDI